jgi:transcriptional regulator with XRE-family HTH domain
MDDYDKFLKRVGTNIARIRKEKGLSLSQLSYIADMEKANIVRIEQSQINPTIKTLWKIAKALEVEASDLIK